MDKQNFLSFCHSEFLNRGFQKVKNMYFLNGTEGVLCGLWLKKSNFGPEYTIIYYFFLGDFSSPKEYPVRYDFDLQGCFEVMSKTNYKGKTFMTGEIQYEKYTEAELIPYFAHTFEEYILPPVQQGKKHLLTFHDHLNSPPLKEMQDIIKKLV